MQTGLQESLNPCRVLPAGAALPRSLVCREALQQELPPGSDIHLNGLNSASGNESALTNVKGLIFANKCPKPNKS